MTMTKQMSAPTPMPAAGRHRPPPMPDHRSIIAPVPPLPAVIASEGLCDHEA